MAAQPIVSDCWSNFKPDPLHPPKYCPQCAWGGEKSRVKKLKIVQESQEWVLMCKNERCPWPFSVMSPAEATVKSEPLPELTAGQKRKIEEDDSEKNGSRKKKRARTLKVTGGEKVTNRHSEQVGQPEENSEVNTDLNHNIVSVKCNEGARTSENDPDQALVERTAESNTCDENGVGSSRVKSKNRKRHLSKLSSNTSIVNNKVIKKSSVEGQHPPVQDQPTPTSDIHTAGGVKCSFLVKVDNLPSGVVPSPPPARGALSPAQLRVTQSLHSRLVSAPSWSSDNIRRLSAIASPPANPRLPVFPRSSSLVDVVTSTETARSLFDIDGPGVPVEGEFVYLGSIEAGSSDSCELSELIDEASVSLVKPVHSTYKRVQRKPNLFNPSSTNLEDEHSFDHVGLNLEADVCTNVNLVKPLNLGTLDLDDNYATVKKLGSGVTMDMELREMRMDRIQEDIRLNPDDRREGNCLVFHVAKETMTTQPSVLGNLEVKEQGSTRVLLTAGSDQVELTELRKEVESYHNNGRGGEGGRKSLSFRGRKKGYRGEEVGEKRAKRTCGKGWFWWRDWRIDEKFILNFSDFLDSLLRKWDPPKNLEVDSRIQALLLEKEAEIEHSEIISKKISFFASVYVKCIYVQTCYPTLTINMLMNMLQKHHRLENQQFAVKIHSLMKDEPLPSQGGLTEISQSGLNTEDVPQNKESELIDERSTNTTNSNTSEHQPEVLQNSPLNLQPEQNSFLDLPLQDDIPVENITHQSDELKQPPSPVYSDSLCSVQVDSAPSYTLLDDVGQGTKLVQFFYTNQETDTNVVFPPVRVNTEEEVKYVVALVTEMAEEFNIKHNIKGESKPQILYSTEAAMARSVLDKKIVKHIKKCFTKNGMKALKPGRQKTAKTWTKKNIVVKAPRRRKSASKELGNVDGKIVDYLSNKNVSGQANETLSKEVEEALLEEIVESIIEEADKTLVEECEDAQVEEVDKTRVEENENTPIEEAQVVEINIEVLENEDEIFDKSPNEPEEKIEEHEDFTIVQLDESVEEEHVPTTEELRLELELKLFGGHLPKVTHQVKAPRGGTSDRTGRGGRNEFSKNIASESVKLGAVEYILACKQRGNDEPLPKPDFNLAALCRKRKSRKKIISIDFDDISDEDDEDYKVPSIYNRKADKLDDKNRRKSERLSEQQARLDSGEYFVAENHDFDNSLGYFWQDHHQPRYRISEDNLSSKAHDQASDPDTPDESQSHANSQDDLSVMTLLEPSQSSALQQVGKDASVKICNPTSVDEWVTGKTISKVSENYLRNSKKSAKVGVFDQVFTRNRNCRKVRKLFRKLKMGENQLMRKYKGMAKVRKQKNLRMVNLGGKVSQEEKNLMKELLEVGNSAYTASNHTSATDVSLCSDTSLGTIREFEDLQTLAVDVDDATADVDTLLQLNC